MRLGARLALVLALLFACAHPGGGAADEFGPRYLVEGVAIRGNARTATALIERQLAVRAGDVVRADDARVEASRYRVLALGLFTDVQIRLQRGTQRGRARLVVEVTERGTLVLNQIFLGGSAAVPLWGGIDVNENNFTGRGIGVGGAYLFTLAGAVPLARPQRAGRLRLATPRLANSPISLSATALYNDASPPYRVAGRDDDGDPARFIAVRHRRAGGIAGVGADVGGRLHLSLDARGERVDADVPTLVRQLPADQGGRLAPVDIGLRPGVSWVATVVGTLDYDSRSDPVLPTSGNRLLASGELATRLFGSDYEFVKLTAQWQAWFRLPWGHVVSPSIQGGVIVGDAPIFDRFYLSDFDPLVPQRVLGLDVSTQPPLDLLHVGIARHRVGTLGGRVGVEYLWPLFHGGRILYGGHLFAAFGGLAFTTTDDARLRDGAALGNLPFDLWFDVGLRLDTYVGVFNLSIANLLGRLPL